MPKATRAADVIVIGAGIIGSSTALRLAQAGLKVQVFERGEPGCEASSAAAGMLAPQSERVEPESFSELCRASHTLYPAFVAEIEELSGMRVDYRSEGSLLVATNDEESRELEEIYQTQKEPALPAEWLTAREVGCRAPGLSPQIRAALFMPQDHWVDNELLVQAVVRACERQGVTFFARSPVGRLSVQKGRVESVEVGGDSAGGGMTFSAGRFVLAAGCWSHQLATSIGVELQMQPCRGQMLEFAAPVEVPLVVRAGYHYLVPRSSRRLLLGTTVEYAGYAKSVTGEGMRSILEGVARFARLPSHCVFRRAWAGLRPDTKDHLPILGYSALENLAFATGHFRNGILLAPVTAQLLSELVLTGSTSRPIEDYGPERFQQGLTVEGGRPAV